MEVITMSIKTYISAFTGILAIGGVVLLMPATAEAQCPAPEAICAYYHPGSMMTATCEGEYCFEMNFAESLRLVATDDRGDYPWVWNLWTYYNEEVSAIGCDLRFNPGNSQKIKMTITGEYGPICRVDVSAGDFIYHNHFGADPDSNCLGWVECREYVNGE
jgi:hypothetical protein